MDSSPSSFGRPSSILLGVRSLQQLVLGNPSANLTVEKMTARILRAAYDGDIPQVKKLANRLREAGKGVEEAVAEFKAPWFKGHGLLHLAASAGKVGMCKFLIRDLRISIDAAGEDGLTPLSFSIYAGRSTTIPKLLLDHGADPNKASIDGSTPLQAAITQDTYEIAELLLSRGAYVDPVSKYGTPIYIAAKDGNTRMLKLLLRHKADPNGAIDVVHTPLKAVISACSLEGMDILIKAGADVNAGTATPLVAAANAGLTDCVKCLLRAGADANLPDDNGRVPIEIAAIQGSRDCIEVLFHVTTPLAGVADWSPDGIIQYAKLTSSKKLQVCILQGDGGSDFEAEGDDAFHKRDYAHALTLYTMAVEVNPDDSTLYAKRSLCFLHTGDKGKASGDANTYKNMQPDLSKSCYLQGAALILVKEYGRACEALMTGLNLDFGSKTN